MKSEPDAYSWPQLLKDKSTDWTGVRNHTAKQNLQKMKKGDLAFFYHSNIGKEIVGIARIVGEAKPDPTDKTGKFVCVKIEPFESLKNPVTLETVKKEKTLADMALIRLSRLSVQPVTAGEWKHILALAGK